MSRTTILAMDVTTVVVWVPVEDTVEDTVEETVEETVEDTAKIPEVPANVGCCLEVRVLKRKSSSFVKSACCTL